MNRWKRLRDIRAHRVMIETVIEKVPLFKIAGRALVPTVGRPLVAFVNMLRRQKVRHLKTPNVIVVFVTNRCTMKCPFCFYRDSINSREPLISVKQFEKIAKTIRPLSRISLTGGEPFLRDDLAHICRAFVEHANAKYISIPTNGFNGRLIAGRVKEILSIERLKYCKVQVSVDGLRQGHDTIRESPGAFNRAVETIGLLKEIEKSHRKFYLEIAANINKLLVDKIDAFIEYFAALELPVKFSIIRDMADTAPAYLPEAMDNKHHEAVSTGNQLSIEQLEQFYERLQTLNSAARRPFWSKLQQLKYEYSLHILKSKKRLFPCYAGSVEGVIYHNGDVAFCEYSKPVGNLHDTGFDFAQLWNSPRAHEMRKNIQRCVCIHGCNLLTAMTYDSKTLLKILKPGK